MQDFQLVNDTYSILDTLKEETSVGVDTEFLREKTFFARLCLIQISSRSSTWCVDPLRSHDYDDFWTALCNGQWVVHSARQDIEVIYQSAGKMPRELFDTQIAAAFLGKAPQMGYGNLVEELFNEQLPKAHTRADWSQRPLPEELLEYAADDVKYLLPMLDILSDELQKLGRLDWAKEDSKLLLDPALYTVDPGDAIERVKGARNFRGKRRAIAAGLAAWREEQAISRDRPRQWIIRDTTLLDIAAQQPKDLKALQGIDGMSPKLAARSGEELLKIVQKPESGHADYEPPRVPDEQEKARLKRLQRIVKRKADELGIAAELLASRKELATAVMSGKCDSRAFSGFRKALIGDAIREALDA